MSDPTDLAATATHVASGLGGAGGVGLLMRLLHSKEAQRMETTLAVLVAKVDQIAESQKKHDNFGERLALVEQSLKAVHERQDGLQTRRRKR